MKQYIFSFLAGVMIFMPTIIAHSAPVTVNTLTSQELVCDGTNVNEYWYVGERHYPRDAMFGDTAYDWKISPSSTISIYNPLGAFQVTGGFNWRSFGQPKGETGIYVWQNDQGSVITAPPTNPNTLVAQIVHRVRRMYSQTPIAGQYTIDYTNLSYQFLSTTVPNFTGPIIVDNECQNIYARWCGDGILDTTHGEQCDLGAQNGQAGSACSATCQSVTVVACIPGTTTGPQAAPLTAASPGLCLGGPTVVGGFTGTTVGTTTTYNWSCNGSAVGGACAATYNSAVACIPGTTTGPQAAPLTATSPGLCLGGPTVVGGFTGTTVGTTTTYNWSCNGSAVGGACAATYNSGSSIPGFDLALKKYIGTNDAQTAPGVSTTNAATHTYIIRVTNSGASSTASSGTTTVQDILPAGVEYTASGSGTGWTCSVALRTLTCTSTQGVAPGAAYPDISVPFRVTATAGQTFTNIAAVDNPNEFRRCMVAGTLPITDTGVCTLDTTNSDPAVLSIPGGNTGGASNVGKKCVNGVATCASYNTLPACIADGIPANLCYAADAVGLNMCQSQSLSCSGPGGGSTTPTGGGGTGVCGDGVLGSSPGEECDVVGAPWCVACKIVMTTNPGANPITDLWMTIPVLAGTQRIGYTWLDNTPGKVAFADNQMVLGVGTKAFTLNDTVGFGIRTQYRIPLILEANKKICLKSEGTSMNSESICTTFGAAASISPTISQWTRRDGVGFVNIGAGDYQIPNPTPQPPRPTALPASHTAQQQAEYNSRLQEYMDWTPYILQSSTSANNITLFKGATQYSRLGESNIGPTLNSAFFGKSADGTNSSIGLFTDTGVDLVKLSVRVSSAVVSSIGSSANRSLESFLNPGNLFAGFLSRTSSSTSTTSNNTTGTATVNLPVIVGGAAGSVSSLADIERYAVNGNKNILAVNGDLTIDCPTGRSVFQMEGVRTVIVTGNLIIKCNLIYASNDTVSSWAWIAKGGNIQVYNGNTAIPSVGAITNLAGVFVAIRETVGGDIVAVDNKTTQAILRVEGSMYGNAAPLFNSRLYARATGAYDILTTGTILTYSNRALVNPPPLLSQYLGNYQVERVVQ